MSLYHGRLLFDIAEDSINGWNENLGTRGMYEKWEKDGKELFIEIEDSANDDDVYYECWVGCDLWIETIAFGSFHECKRAATEYMKKH